MSNKFGIYIHVPYCTKVCPYCNFNVYSSYVADYEKLVELILKDLRSKVHLFKDKNIVSIHFGGGTPSLLDSKLIKRILVEIKKICHFESHCEIGIEINPYDTEVEDLGALSEIGINRVSVGIQSFNNSKLKILGRKSTSESNQKFISKIARSEIKNINFDFIFGVDNESLIEWEKELSFLSEIDVKHISTYCLTIEEKTPFSKMRDRGEISDIVDETFIEMTKITKKKLKEIGIDQYEISNFSKPSYESKHNLLYWNCDSYLGLGPGAHSSLINVKDKIYYRWSNPNTIIEYEKFLNVPWNKSILEGFSLGIKEYVRDGFMMGLRLKKGINIKFLQSIESFRLFEEDIDNMTREKLVEYDGYNLRLTDKGFNLSDEVIFRTIESISFIDA
mgnify:FL=1